MVPHALFRELPLSMRTGKSRAARVDGTSLRGMLNLLVECTNGNRPFITWLYGKYVRQPAPRKEFTNHVIPFREGSPPKPLHAGLHAGERSTRDDQTESVRS